MASSATKPILILGGGLIGLSIAHALADEGREVEILSRRRSEAAGFVAAGMLAPHAEGLNKTILKLGQMSQAEIPEWIAGIEKSSGINCGLKQCGIVVPFINSQERDEYETASFGEILSRNQLEQEIPGIASHWKTGLLFEQDGQIDNRRRLMRALEKACFEKGVHFQEGVEIIEILTSEDKFQGVLVKNIENELEEIHAEAAVLCCGAWSQIIVDNVKIHPVKGQLLSIQGPKNSLKRILFGPGIYLVPRDDGLIIVGATSEKEALFNQGITPSGQRELREGIKNLLPIANNWPQMERWWGFRPCTPDTNPIIGKTSWEGLWIATGHYRNGVLLAAITSKIIRKSICDMTFSPQENTFLREFSLQRFKNK